MATDNTLLRSVNELSLAAWFGGSLMGATGLRRAASSSAHEMQAEGDGWRTWQPVQALAIVSQLASGAGLTVANRGRYVAQRGVASTSMARTALTAGAVAATAMAARSGRLLAEAESTPDVDSEHFERLRRRTRLLQWLVPLLTGGLIVLDAAMGEQQRPQRVARGVASRLIPGR